MAAEGHVAIDGKSEEEDKQTDAVPNLAHDKLLEGMHTHARPSCVDDGLHKEHDEEGSNGEQDEGKSDEESTTL
eukprot:1931257-Prymnesium_polylepis.2